VLRIVFGAMRKEVSYGLGILKREEVNNVSLPLIVVLFAQAKHEGSDVWDV